MRRHEEEINKAVVMGLSELLESQKNREGNHFGFQQLI